MSQEKSRDERIKERTDQASEEIVDVFASAAREAADRIVEIMRASDKETALLAAKKIVGDIRPPKGQGIVINTAPTFVSNLGLPAAPSPKLEAIQIKMTQRKVKQLPKAPSVILPEAAERPDFGERTPVDKFLPKESFDVTKVVAPTPDRPPSQVIDFPTASRPPQVPIPPDLKAE
jgi:hypothetical protein